MQQSYSAKPVRTQLKVPVNLFCVCRVFLLTCSCVLCAECLWLFFGDIVRLRWRRGATAWWSAGPESISKIQLQVSRNAPEAYVTLDSNGAYELKTRVAVIKVLLGRDSRSVRALVPDVKVLGRDFMTLHYWISAFAVCSGTVLWSVYARINSSSVHCWYQWENSDYEDG